MSTPGKRKRCTVKLATSSSMTALRPITAHGPTSASPATRADASTTAEASMPACAARGGLKSAGLVGVILPAGAHRLPVVLDGFIAGAAALVAARLKPDIRPALIAAHRSSEPGHARVLDDLGLEPYLDLGMRLGEGTGAALCIGLARAACAVFTEMATFKSAGVSDRADPSGASS